MKRLILFVVLLLVAVGSGGYAFAQARQPEAAYSTATATRADVERTLDLSGTVTATGRRDLGFGTSGSVSKVSVKAGQRVRKGQVLARLDAAALEAEVTAAEATLARAKAQLASDEDAQASAVTDAASNAGGGQNLTGQKPSSPPKSPSTPSTPAKPDPALQQALAELATGQRAVTGAQTAASEAIAAAKAALADQIQKCQAASADPETTEGDDADQTGLSPACTAALDAVQEAQDTVAQKQDQLQTALAGLSETLTKAVTAVTKSTQSPQANNNASQTPSGSQSQGAPEASTATVSPSSSSDDADDGSSGGTVTAARLAQDQADIDTANARLGEARAARRLATLRAPYAGRILQADLARGDQTSSSDKPFVLVGLGVSTVTTAVTTAQIPDVRRGQKVAVTPAGWTSPMNGTVTEVGVLPDSSGTFPVTVTVDSARTVSEGSTASVSIVTAVAKGAVTVPTSAIARNGNRAVVQVLTGQTVTRTSVTVGVVGKRRASITKGLEAGAVVVLADLAAEVPSSNNPGQGFRNGPPGGELEGPRVQFKER